MPVLLHFEEAAGAAQGTSVLLGHPAPPEGFSPPAREPEDGRLAGASVVVKARDALSLTASFGTMDLNGTKTFVWRIPAGDPVAANLPTLVHEDFHFFQQSWKRSPRETGPGGTARFQQTAEAMADVTIEHMLLGRAVAAPDGYEQTARQFSTLRTARHAAGRPGNPAWEAAQEAVEGMAALVEYRFLDEHMGAGFPRGALTRQHVLARLFEGLDRSASETKLRYYGSGAAQGLLLDRAGVRWRERVAGGDALFAVFMERFPPLPDAGAVVHALRHRNDHRALTVLARAQAAQEALTEERLRGMFAHFEGLKLVLRGNPLRSAGTSEGMAAGLGAGGWAQEQDSSEVPWDGVFSLRLHGAATMWAPGRPSKTEVLLGPTALVSVLADGKAVAGQGRKTFHELEIRSPHAKLRLLRPGTLVREGALLILELPEGAARP